jgi:hypothetical protein
MMLTLLLSIAIAAAHVAYRCSAAMAANLLSSACIAVLAAPMPTIC